MAVQNGAQLIAFPELSISGYEREHAQKHKMSVLMSNFSGESWGYPSGGKSAFWNNKGELIEQMNDLDSGLLLVENQNDNWKSRVVKI